MFVRGIRFSSRPWLVSFMGDSPFALCTGLPEVKEPSAGFPDPFAGKRTDTDTTDSKLAYFRILSSVRHFRLFL